MSAIKLMIPATKANTKKVTVNRIMVMLVLLRVNKKLMPTTCCFIKEASGRKNQLLHRMGKNGSKYYPQLLSACCFFQQKAVF
jgi:hypothetical protein